jgi:hypothetical protein
MRSWNKAASGCRADKADGYTEERQSSQRLVHR